MVTGIMNQTLATEFNNCQLLATRLTSSIFYFLLLLWDLVYVLF
jgi:hypothetical protein